MINELRRRWSVIPTWIKVVPVVLLLAGLSLANHYLAPTRPDLATLVQRLFFLPVFMASLLFGLTGGLICAALVSLNYLDLWWGAGVGRNHMLLAAAEMLLYFITGGLTGFLVDRERREARRVKEAENLALLGQAAAAVAHELKTPLIAIGGFAQRIQRDLEPSHPYRGQLRIIVDQVRHMENLLRQMLDYSRPLELQRRNLALDGLLQEVFTLTRPTAKEKRVSLASHLPPGGLSLAGDAGRLKQVLINLVNNAVDASGKGGEVVVEADREKDQVVIAVRDAGVGIPAAEREKIFFPFFTTKSGGTGLGLAIARKIVLAHHGDIQVESTPGQGTTFRLLLPQES
ncbi:MAG: HAMP domain-containing histidine kinase [Desulfarculaceae bacterium]|nr:HAMP domain-containing histidine kinase [Desulfarculaceae bacterium]MCF8070923.1 HAMP domain-containing histidine kinase [Desulfarculaceae bacterium]MCF8100511.1 HAMP domain-containing histidine kinase [Desulfarculaceae bacterium]MCF8116537.1 HAMP domain-containing histidine kinase [Desulfarculaceae bacterium]